MRKTMAVLLFIAAGSAQAQLGDLLKKLDPSKAQKAAKAVRAATHEFSEGEEADIGRVVAAMQSIGGEVIITADHGNVEMMMDNINHQPHTQHTTNLVPMLYIGRPATLAETGALSDLAPTLLKMMGLPQPAEMTGKPLVTFAQANAAASA